MAFKVKPFVEVLTMRKREIDAELAPIRAKAARAKADLSCAKLDEELVSLERSIYEACVSPDINFEAIIGQMDRYDLAERKRRQIGNLIDELFPQEKK
jgi:hypothetical protein